MNASQVAAQVKFLSRISKLTSFDETQKLIPDTTNYTDFSNFQGYVSAVGGTPEEWFLCDLSKPVDDKLVTQKLLELGAMCHNEEGYEADISDQEYPDTPPDTPTDVLFDAWLLYQLRNSFP